MEYIAIYGGDVRICGGDVGIYRGGVGSDASYTHLPLTESDAGSSVRV